jgi:hypothetical protein
MEFPVMKAAPFYLHAMHRLLRLGVPGGIGFLLLVAAMAWTTFAYIPDSQRVDRLQRQMAALEVRLAEPEGEMPASPAEQLQSFYQSIPSPERIPDRLSAIYSLAKAQGLTLDVGDYNTLSHDNSGRLDRFQMTFPVKGSYPKIRQFIFTAIAETPGLALDGIAFKREEIGDPKVEARLTFLLFVEKAK